jgi:LPS O-antigen subunit length determinant protein (WzzB/FepE family)
VAFINQPTKSTTTIRKFMTEKKQLISPAVDHIQGPHSLPEDEISLMDLLETLLRKRVHVIMVVFIFTLSSIFYAQSITPTYRATIGFLPPSNISLTTYFDLKTYLYTLKTVPKNAYGKPKEEETQREKQQFLFLHFLNTIRSQQFQEKVVIAGNFLQRLAENEPDANMKKVRLDEISQFIRINLVGTLDKTSIFNTTTYLEITGTKPEVMSGFLNSLGDAAIKETAKNIKESLQQEIDFQTNLYSAKLELLDSQIKADRLKKVHYLSEHLEIAKNLGILENNLGAMPFSPLSTSFSEDQWPLWYIYGQRALEQKIAMINSPSYLDQDMPKARELTLKIKALSKIDLSKKNFKPAIISQPSVVSDELISQDKVKIIVIGAAIGLIAGIVLAFLSNVLDHMRARSKSVTLE